MALTRGSSSPAASGAAKKMRKVVRVSVVEDVAKQLMDLIARGNLKPGERLPSERELCSLFGVGRSSLREALRCLSMVGILDARVGAGTTVAKSGARFIEKTFEWSLLSEQNDIRALVQVRVALEGAAVAEAALHADAPELAAMEKLLLQMEDCLNDGPRFAELDLAFHVAISRASNNSLLFGLLTMIRSQLVLGMQRVLPLPNALRLSHEEHKDIFGAVRSRDSNLARQKMQAHLAAALERYGQTVRS